MLIDNLYKTENEILEKVNKATDTDESLLLTYMNQNSFNIYFKNKTYANILNQDFVVYQADLGVYLALKILFRMQINKIDATRLNHFILEKIKNKNLPVVIVGSKLDENFVRNELKKRGLNLEYYHSGYFSEKETNSVIEKISLNIRQIFIVGMGVPRQELFARQLRERFQNAIIICVGDFLELYFGTKKRAPKFIQTIGCEWIYRMLSEPKRLWRRYLIGVPLFFIQMLKMKFSPKLM